MPERRNLLLASLVTGILSPELPRCGVAVTGILSPFGAPSGVQLT